MMVQMALHSPPLPFQVNIFPGLLIISIHCTTR